MTREIVRNEQGKKRLKERGGVRARLNYNDRC